jgi:hypothetical protein
MTSCAPPARARLTLSTTLAWVSHGTPARVAVARVTPGTSFHATNPIFTPPRSTNAGVIALSKVMPTPVWTIPAWSRSRTEEATPAGPLSVLWFAAM